MSVQKPVLVVMAAGLGSRFGGMKQVRPVGPNGQTLMDYSLYDAARAGFEQAVFVISPAMEEDFPREMEARVGKRLNVRFAVQRLTDVPGGLSVPEGRTKPWGTGHAVRACRDLVGAPFAAINADDYYGPSGFRGIFDFLRGAQETMPREYAMVGYELKKTLSETGYVARGICDVDENGMLVEIHERTHIISTQEGALYTEDGQIYRKLPDSAVASMNLWGFSADFMGELDRRFEAFLRRALVENPLKAECYLPEIVGEMLREGKAKVRVLPCAERWYGMTYQEDAPIVVEAIRGLTERGVYPETLWA